MGWINLREFGMKDSLILKFMKEFKEFEILIRDENLRLLNADIRNKVLKAAISDNKKFYDKLNENNIELLEYTDDRYPENLKNIQDPPLFLYIRGKIEFSDRNIAVVGTRRNTVYGKVSCESILKELLEYNVTIVSGLATGIDNIAHEFTIKKKGRCIGVIGSGLDRIFPYESRKLWERIPENGMLISEYPLGSEPLKWNFPRRNRIIAGISQGILLCESYARGGGLITSELGFQYNRDVFAVPGFINYPSFRGCNNLIRESKAKLVLSGRDIANEFLWEKSFSEIENIEMTAEEREIFLLLNTEKSIDQIIWESGFNISKVLSALANLEVKNLIFEISGGKYKGR